MVRVAGYGGPITCLILPAPVPFYLYTWIGSPERGTVAHQHLVKSLSVAKECRHLAGILGDSFFFPIDYSRNLDQLGLHLQTELVLAHLQRGGGAGDIGKVLVEFDVQLTLSESIRSRAAQLVVYMVSDSERRVEGCER